METQNNLRQFLNFCWKDVFGLIENAAVYLDHTVAECLHWYTGDRAYAILKDAGAVSIHEIAMYNFSVGNILTLSLLIYV